MWRQQNKGKELFEEILNDRAKYNPLWFLHFFSLKVLGEGKRALVFLVKWNSFEGS